VDDHGKEEGRVEAEATIDEGPIGDLGRGTVVGEGDVARSGRNDADDQVTNAWLLLHDVSPAARMLFLSLLGSLLNAGW
jgi:hypothetical protein